MQGSGRKNMPGHIRAVQPKLLKQFFAIELHPAVYLSFVAININVFLLTIIWRSWSEESLKTACAEPPPVVIAETHKPCVRQKVDLATAPKDDQTTSVPVPTKQEDKLAPHIVTANTAVALRHPTASLHGKGVTKRKISSKTHARSSAYFVPPPPPLVPFGAWNDGEIATAKENRIANLASSDEIQQDRGRLGRQKRKASYTIEADDLKQVIVER
jgi:hypothetical protein